MNQREFFTQALLSSHNVLLAEVLPGDLPDDVEQLEADVVPIAEKTAKVAALYAAELTTRWLMCMESYKEMDEESPDVPSTRNLTKPAPEVLSSKN